MLTKEAADSAALRLVPHSVDIFLVIIFKIALFLVDTAVGFGSHVG